MLGLAFDPCDHAEIAVADVVRADDLDFGAGVLRGVEVETHGFLFEPCVTFVGDDALLDQRTGQRVVTLYELSASVGLFAVLAADERPVGRHAPEEDQHRGCAARGVERRGAGDARVRGDALVVNPELLFAVAVGPVDERAAFEAVVPEDILGEGCGIAVAADALTVPPVAGDGRMDVFDHPVVDARRALGVPVARHDGHVVVLQQHEQFVLVFEVVPDVVPCAVVGHEGHMAGHDELPDLRIERPEVLVEPCELLRGDDLVVLVASVVEHVVEHDIVDLADVERVVGRSEILAVFGFGLVVVFVFAIDKPSPVEALPLATSAL